MNPSRAFYSASGRHRAADGGDHAGRSRRAALSAAVRAARRRLSDHPGADLLSGREPGRDDLVGHRAARTAVRADAVLEPDVVAKLGGLVDHHAAIQPRPAARHRRAGSPGGDQRRGQPAAVRPARAADLREGQPGRRADHHARDHLEDHAAHAGAGSRRHASRAEDLAGRGRGSGEPVRAVSARPCGFRRTRARWPRMV